MNVKDAMPKDRRFKVIIVTAIAAALIIAIGVWAITSAVNSTKNKTAAETAKTETAKTEETTTSTTGSPAVSPSTEYNASATTTAPAPTTTTSNNIPTTGPSDVLVSALALGAIVALALVNIDLVKKQEA